MRKEIKPGGYVPVEQGESIDSIAVACGHLPDTIWEAPQNEELRKTRDSPHVLLPGDRLFLPPINPKKVTISTGQRHEFVVKRRAAKLNLRIEEWGQPRANEPYVLRVGNLQLQGTTTDDGWVNASIPTDAEKAELTVGRGERALTLLVALRHLDPADEISGAQGRLANLGYGALPQDGVLGPETEAALRAFQHAHKLEENGTLDEKTVAALLDKHGS